MYSSAKQKSAKNNTMSDGVAHWLTKYVIVATAHMVKKANIPSYGSFVCTQYGRIMTDQTGPSVQPKRSTSKPQTYFKKCKKP